ncbi:unconventional myosin-XIX-like [Octopus sinensis]|uniref:Unconventional myosin-XIX-like n=1 Tax=Octopus sinensis TaxID=2607531 RepID=A0A6P7TLR8_9MOLL|nr:unconventional myosin-XIX-like [Octopus sinensis]
MDEKERIATMPSYAVGSTVFVADPDQVWVPGVVTQVSDDNFVIQVGQKEVVASMKDLLTNMHETPQSCENLTKLTVINSATVLTCLDLRFQQDAVYTSGGNILVAVNPFKELHHLYSEELIHTYAAAKGSFVEPHIFGCAKLAYDRMCGQFGKDHQTIMVSGESGAGKTVSAKHLLKYLTVVSSQNLSLESSMTGRKIETKILKSNPILEAFGNATTTRNENSSRFGKYIQLNFNRSGNMKGAAISTYLLEKTRVVHQGPAECNFHIFYQMMQPGLRGTNTIGQLFEDFDQSIAFRILPGPSERSAGKDSEMLQNTLKALEEIGVTENQTKQIFQILLAILYLGNIEFMKGQDEDTTKIKQSKGSSDAMKNACNLLCIDSRQLQHILLHRNIHSGRKGRESMFVKPVRQAEAANRRDCLAMLLYSSLFNWLVSYINDQFHGNSCKQSIGLLDIYGFECFQQNSLEQLCINYANERLQQHYVQHFLRDLQNEYIDENIEWTYTEFEDNQPHIDLLDGTCGVFALLNEEVYLNRPKDLVSLGNRLVEVTNGKASHRQPLTPRLHNKINDSSSAAQRSQKKNSEKFSPRFLIRHYCDIVDYEAREMVEKNKDNIPSEVENLVKTSHLDFVQEILTSRTTTTTTTTPSKKKKTVLTKFKTSLDQLMLSLNASDVHYVRCLKPNKDCVPNKFDRLFMMSQLKASGILETVEISHQGHPVRMTYADFLRRYSVVRSNKGPASGQRLDGALQDDVSIDHIISTIANRRLQVRERVKRTPTPRKVMRRRTADDEDLKDLQILLCCAYLYHCHHFCTS